MNHFADFAELCFRRFGDRVRMWTTLNGARHPDQPRSREPRAPAAHFSSPTRAPQRRGRSPFLGTALARRRRASRSQTSAGTRTWRGIMCSSRTPKQCAASERARAAAGGSASRITLTGASRRAVLRRTLLLRSAPTSGGSAGLPTRSGSATTLRRCAQSSASHCLPPSLAHATWSPMLTRTVSPPGERLPAFTADERRMLHGSADFFGLNHYGSRLAKARPTGPMYGEDGGDPFSYWADAEVQTLHPEEWPASASVWLFSVPWGLRKLLNWIDRRYGRPPIYVTENGWSTPGGEDVAAAVADSAAFMPTTRRRCSARSMRMASTCAATSRGRCSTTSSGPASRHQTGPPTPPDLTPRSLQGARLLGALRPSVHRLCDAATPAEGVGALVLRAHHGERRPRPGRLRWRGFMLLSARRRGGAAACPCWRPRCRHRRLALGALLSWVMGVGKVGPPRLRARKQAGSSPVPGRCEHATGGERGKQARDDIRIGGASVQ